MSEEEQRVAAAAAQVDDSDLPPPSPTGAGNDIGGGLPWMHAMSLTQLMAFLAQQNLMVDDHVANNAT